MDSLYSVGGYCLYFAACILGFAARGSILLFLYVTSYFERALSFSRAAKTVNPAPSFVV